MNKIRKTEFLSFVVCVCVPHVTTKLGQWKSNIYSWQTKICVLYEKIHRFKYTHPNMHAIKRVKSHFGDALGLSAIFSIQTIGKKTGGFFCIKLPCKKFIDYLHNGIVHFNAAWL